MVGVDTVFSQLRSKVGNFQFIQLACTRQRFGGISGFPRDFSTCGVNWVSGFDPEDSKGC